MRCESFAPPREEFEKPRDPRAVDLRLRPVSRRPATDPHLLAAMEPTPFTPTFAKADVDRMMARVRDARLPTNEVMPEKSWEYGTDPSWLADLQSTWADQWSYDAFEKQLQR